MFRRGMQGNRLQHKEMGQGPLGLEKAAAGLYIASLCLCEAMVRPDRGVLIQETDLLDEGNTIVVTT